MVSTRGKGKISEARDCKILDIRIVDVLYNSGSEASKKIVEAFAAGLAKVVEFANRRILRIRFSTSS